MNEHLSTSVWSDVALLPIIFFQKIHWSCYVGIEIKSDNVVDLFFTSTIPCWVPTYGARLSICPDYAVAISASTGAIEVVEEVSHAQILQDNSEPDGN